MRTIENQTLDWQTDAPRDCAYLSKNAMYVLCAQC